MSRNMNDILVNLYSKPQIGGDLAYFQGNQYGAGWLRSLGRIAFPILKSLVGIATNTAEDVVMKDKKFGEAVKSNVFGKPVKRIINKHKHVRRFR